MLPWQQIVPGSISARQNGNTLKVKEKLRYSWDLKRPIVIGIEVLNAVMFGDVTIRCSLYGLI